MTDSGVVAVLNGPNLNLLGVRNPDVYGHETLDDVADRCTAAAGRHGWELDFRQTNHEGVCIDWVHQLRTQVVGLVINAGGWTHTSVALRDAVETVEAPVVEVHISDIHAREPFRHFSYLAAVSARSIVGHGTAGYVEAIDAIAELSCS